ALATAAAAVSCSKPQPKDTIEPDKTEKDAGSLGKVSNAENGEDSGKAELPPPQNPPAPKVFRKRVRTATVKAPPKFSKGGDLANYAIQNPNDAEGRAVFVASDDSCFIKVPKDFKSKTPMPPGMPWYTPKTVDCPVEADDPAY